MWLDSSINYAQEYRKRDWPNDWVKSFFVPIPEKGDAQVCSNNRTVALISHCSKINLTIISERIKTKLQQANDMVSREVLWKTMLTMGFPKHIVELIQILYGHQSSAARTTRRLTDWFGIGQGVRQGCVPSPHLFRNHNEYCTRRVSRNWWQNNKKPAISRLLCSNI